MRALIGIVLKHVNKLNIVKRARLLSSHIHDSFLPYWNGSA